MWWDDFFPSSDYYENMSTKRLVLYGETHLPYKEIKYKINIPKIY